MKLKKAINKYNKSNWFLIDKSISLEAKGLLHTLLLLPEEKSFSINDIYCLSTDSVDNVNKVLQELVNHKYIKIDYKNNEYKLYEKPYQKEKNLER